MIKKEMSIKRCLIAASMAGTMVFSSIPAVPVFADTTSTNKIHADLYGDYVSVDGYNFWTTKVPKPNKIPSADKWSYGDADLSSIKKETSVFFSKTPNPKTLSEIVKVDVSGKEAAPKFKFLAGNELAKGADKDGYDTEKAVAMIDQLAVGMQFATSYTPYYYSTIRSDDDDYEYYDDEYYGENFAYWLERALENGATFSFRKAGSENASGEADPSTTADTMTSIDLKSFNRPGVAKTVKIPKRANGPAASINYATHTIKVKNGGSYMVLDGDEYTYGDVEEKTASFNAVTDKKGFEVGVRPNQIVAIRTSASTKKVASKITYVHVDASAEASFSSTGAQVAIVGENGGAATLQINSDTAKEAYQYVIVAATSLGDYVTGDDTKGYEFNYTKAAGLKWKSLKTATKNSVTSASTALKWASNAVQAGSYVFVRKAATKTEYSSEVMIFKAPSADGEGWSKVDFEQYNSTLSNATKLPTLKLEYDGEKDAFRLKSTGAGTAQFVANKTITGKTTKNFKEKTASVASGSASYVCIKRDKLPEATGNAQEVTFTIPKGSIEYTVGDQKILGQATSFKISYSSSDKWSTDDVTSSNNGNVGDTTGGGTTTTTAETLSVSSVVLNKGAQNSSTYTNDYSLVITFNNVKNDVNDISVSVKNGGNAIPSTALTIGDWTISGNTATSTLSGSGTGAFASGTITVDISGFKNTDGVTMTPVTGNSVTVNNS